MGDNPYVKFIPGVPLIGGTDNNSDQKSEDIKENSNQDAQDLSNDMFNISFGLIRPTPKLKGEALLTSKKEEEEEKSEGKEEEQEIGVESDQTIEASPKLYEKTEEQKKKEREEEEILESGYRTLNEIFAAENRIKKFKSDTIPISDIKDVTGKPLEIISEPWLEELPTAGKFHFTYGDTTYTMTSSLDLQKQLIPNARTNNPGNVNLHPEGKTPWDAIALGVEEREDGNGFLGVYSSNAHGMYANMLYLDDKLEKKSDLRELIHMYAPPNENPTEEYIKFVTKRLQNAGYTNFNSDTPFNDIIDSDTPDKGKPYKDSRRFLKELYKAIMYHEGYREPSGYLNGRGAKLDEKEKQKIWASLKDSLDENLETAMFFMDHPDIAQKTAEALNEKYKELGVQFKPETREIDYATSSRDIYKGVYKPVRIPGMSIGTVDPQYDLQKDPKVRKTQEKINAYKEVVSYTIGERIKEALLTLFGFKSLADDNENIVQLGMFQGIDITIEELNEIIRKKNRQGDPKREKSIQDFLKQNQDQKQEEDSSNVNTQASGILQQSQQSQTNQSDQSDQAYIPHIELTTDPDYIKWSILNMESSNTPGTGDFPIYVSRGSKSFFSNKVVYDEELDITYTPGNGFIPPTARATWEKTKINLKHMVKMMGAIIKGYAKYGTWGPALLLEDLQKEYPEYTEHLKASLQNPDLGFFDKLVLFTHHMPGVIKLNEEYDRALAPYHINDPMPEAGVIASHLGFHGKDAALYAWDSTLSSMGFSMPTYMIFIAQAMVESLLIYLAVQSGVGAGALAAEGAELSSSVLSMNRLRRMLKLANAGRKVTKNIRQASRVFTVGTILTARAAETEIEVHDYLKTAIHHGEQMGLTPEESLSYASSSLGEIYIANMSLATFDLLEFGIIAKTFGLRSFLGEGLINSVTNNVFLKRSVGKMGVKVGVSRLGNSLLSRGFIASGSGIAVDAISEGFEEFVQYSVQQAGFKTMEDLYYGGGMEKMLGRKSIILSPDNWIFLGNMPYGMGKTFKDKEGRLSMFGGAFGGGFFTAAGKGLAYVKDKAVGNSPVSLREKLDEIAKFSEKYGTSDENLNIIFNADNYEIVEDKDHDGNIYQRLRLKKHVAENLSKTEQGMATVIAINLALQQEGLSDFTREALLNELDAVIDITLANLVIHNDMIGKPGATRMMIDYMHGMIKNMSSKEARAKYGFDIEILDKVRKRAEYIQDLLREANDIGVIDQLGPEGATDYIFATITEEYLVKGYNKVIDVYEQKLKDGTLTAAEEAEYRSAARAYAERIAKLYINWIAKYGKEGTSYADILKQMGLTEDEIEFLGLNNLEIAKELGNTIKNYVATGEAGVVETVAEKAQEEAKRRIKNTEQQKKSGLLSSIFSAIKEAINNVRAKRAASKISKTTKLNVGEEVDLENLKEKDSTRKHKIRKEKIETPAPPEEAKEAAREALADEIKTTHEVVFNEKMSDEEVEKFLNDVEKLKKEGRIVDLFNSLGSLRITRASDGVISAAWKQFYAALASVIEKTKQSKSTKYGILYGPYLAFSYYTDKGIVRHVLTRVIFDTKNGRYVLLTYDIARGEYVLIDFAQVLMAMAEGIVFDIKIGKPNAKSHDFMDILVKYQEIIEVKNIALLAYKHIRSVQNKLDSVRDVWVQIVDRIGEMLKARYSKTTATVPEEQLDEILDFVTYIADEIEKNMTKEMTQDSSVGLLWSGKSPVAGEVAAVLDKIRRVQKEIRLSRRRKAKAKGRKGKKRLKKGVFEVKFSIISPLLTDIILYAQQRGIAVPNKNIQEIIEDKTINELLEKLGEAKAFTLSAIYSIIDDFSGIDEQLRNAVKLIHKRASSVSLESKRGKLIDKLVSNVTKLLKEAKNRQNKIYAGLLNIFESGSVEYTSLARALTHEMRMLGKEGSEDYHSDIALILTKIYEAAREHLAESENLPYIAEKLDRLNAMTSEYEISKNTYNKKQRKSIEKGINDLINSIFTDLYEVGALLPGEKEGGITLASEGIVDAREDLGLDERINIASKEDLLDVLASVWRLKRGERTSLRSLLLGSFRLFSDQEDPETIQTFLMATARTALSVDKELYAQFELNTLIRALKETIGKAERAEHQHKKVVEDNNPFSDDDDEGKGGKKGKVEPVSNDEVPGEFSKTILINTEDISEVEENTLDIDSSEALLYILSTSDNIEKLFSLIPGLQEAIKDLKGVDSNLKKAIIYAAVNLALVDGKNISDLKFIESIVNSLQRFEESGEIGQKVIAVLANGLNYILRYNSSAKDKTEIIGNVVNILNNLFVVRAYQLAQHQGITLETILQTLKNHIALAEKVLNVKIEFTDKFTIKVIPNIKGVQTIILDLRTESIQNDGALAQLAEELSEQEKTFIDSAIDILNKFDDTTEQDRTVIAKSKRRRGKKQKEQKKEDQQKKTKPTDNKKILDIFRKKLFKEKKKSDIPSVPDIIPQSRSVEQNLERQAGHLEVLENLVASWSTTSMSNENDFKTLQMLQREDGKVLITDDEYRTTRNYIESFYQSKTVEQARAAGPSFIRIIGYKVHEKTGTIYFVGELYSVTPKSYKELTHNGTKLKVIIKSSDQLITGESQRDSEKTQQFFADLKESIDNGIRVFIPVNRYSSGRLNIISKEGTTRVMEVLPSRLDVRYIAARIVFSTEYEDKGAIYLQNTIFITPAPGLPYLKITDPFGGPRLVNLRVRNLTEREANLVVDLIERYLKETDESKRVRLYNEIGKYIYITPREEGPGEFSTYFKEVKDKIKVVVGENTYELNDKGFLSIADRAAMVKFFTEKKHFAVDRRLLEIDESTNGKTGFKIVTEVEADGTLVETSYDSYVDFLLRGDNPVLVIPAKIGKPLFTLGELKFTATVIKDPSVKALYKYRQKTFSRYIGKKGASNYLGQDIETVRKNTRTAITAVLDRIIEAQSALYDLITVYSVTESNLDKAGLINSVLTLEYRIEEAIRRLYTMLDEYSEQGILTDEDLVAISKQLYGRVTTGRTFTSSIQLKQNIEGTLNRLGLIDQLKKKFSKETFDQKQIELITSQLADWVTSGFTLRLRGHAARLAHALYSAVLMSLEPDSKIALERKSGNRYAAIDTQTELEGLLDQDLAKHGIAYAILTAVFSGELRINFAGSLDKATRSNVADKLVLDSKTVAVIRNSAVPQGDFLAHTPSEVEFFIPKYSGEHLRILAEKTLEALNRLNTAIVETYDLPLVKNRRLIDEHQRRVKLFNKVKNLGGGRNIVIQNPGSHRGSGVYLDRTAINDLMHSMTMFVSKELFNNVDILLNPEKLNAHLEKTYRRFFKNLERLYNKLVEKGHNRTESEVILTALIGDILTVKDALKERHKKILDDLGFDIDVNLKSIIESLSAEEREALDDYEEELSDEAITDYIEESFQFSQYRYAAPIVKLMLLSIPNSNSVTIFGYNTPKPISETWGTLSNVLAGTVSMEAMIERLNELSQYSELEWLGSVARTLESIENIMDKDIRSDTEARHTVLRASRFKALFYKSFAKANVHHFEVLARETSDEKIVVSIDRTEQAMSRSIEGHFMSIGLAGSSFGIAYSRLVKNYYREVSRARAQQKKGNNKAAKTILGNAEKEFRQGLSTLLSYFDNLTAIETLEFIGLPTSSLSEHLFSISEEDRQKWEATIPGISKATKIFSDNIIYFKTQFKELAKDNSGINREKKDGVLSIIPAGSWFMRDGKLVHRFERGAPGNIMSSLRSVSRFLALTTNKTEVVFRTHRGKQVFSVTDYTYLTRLIALAKEHYNKTGQPLPLFNNKYNRNNMWELHRLTPVVIMGFNLDGYDYNKEFSKSVPVDMVATHVLTFLSRKILPTIRSSERRVEYGIVPDWIISAKTLRNYLDIYYKITDEDATEPDIVVNVKEDLIDIYWGYFLDEYQRYQDGRGNLDLFDYLSDEVMDRISSGEEITEDSDLGERIKDEIADYLQDYIIRQIRYMASEEVGFLEIMEDSETGTLYYHSELLDNTVIHEDLEAEYKGKGRSFARNLEMLALFLVNSHIGNIEQVKWIFGPIESYGRQFYKRTTGTTSSGRHLLLDAKTEKFIKETNYTHLDESSQERFSEHFNLEDPVYSTFGVAVLSSPIIEKSAFYDNIYNNVRDILIQQGVKAEEAEARAKEIADEYTNIEYADGQAWMTFEAYRHYSILNGTWTAAEEQVYMKYQAGEKLTYDDIVMIANLKPMYFGPEAVPGTLSPLYLKTAVLPIIPALYGTQLGNLAESLNRSGAHFAIVDSGVKVGPENADEDINVVEDFSSPQELKVVKGYWAFLKDQQNVGFKGHGRLKLGVQIINMIWTDMDPDAVIVYYDTEKEDQRALYVKQLHNATHQTMYQIMVNQMYSLLYDLGILTFSEYDTTIPTAEGTAEDVIKGIIDTFIKSRRGIDVFEFDDLIDLIEILKGAGVAPNIDMLANSPDLQSSVLSRARENVVRIKMPGMYNVQVSAHLFTKENVLTLDQIDKKTASKIIWLTENGKPKELDFVNVKELKDRNGKTRKYTDYGEILIPYTAFANMPEHIQQAILSGEYKIEFEKDADKGILYRTPTQGPSSSMHFRIVGILPKELEHTVVVPPEIVTQSDSDFDFDKLSILLKPPIIIDDKKNKTVRIRTVKTGYFKELDRKQAEEIWEDRTNIFRASKSRKVIENAVEIFGPSIVTKEVQEELSRRISEYIEQEEDFPGAAIVEQTTEERLTKMKQIVLEYLEEKGLKEEFVQNAVGKTFEKVATSVELETRLLRLFEIRYQDPNFFTSLVSTASTASLKEHAKKVRRLRGIEDIDEIKGSRLIEFDFGITTAYNYLFGKTNISIGAVATWANYVTQTANIGINLTRLSELINEEYNAKSRKMLGDKIILSADFFENQPTRKITLRLADIKKVGDIEVLDLSRKFDNVSTLISSTLSKFMSSYVDVAKDPFINEYIFVTEMTNLLMVMLKAGVTPEQFIMLMNQPIVRDYFIQRLKRKSAALRAFIPEEEQFESGGITGDVAYKRTFEFWTEETTASMNEDPTSEQEEVDDKAFSIETLAENIEKYTKGEEIDLEQQIAYLKEVKKWTYIANEFNEFTGSIRFHNLFGKNFEATAYNTSKFLMLQDRGTIYNIDEVKNTMPGLFLKVFMDDQLMSRLFGLSAFPEEYRYEYIRDAKNVIGKVLKAQGLQLSDLTQDEFAMLMRHVKTAKYMATIPDGEFVALMVKEGYVHPLEKARVAAANLKAKKAKNKKKTVKAEGKVGPSVVQFFLKHNMDPNSVLYQHPLFEHLEVVAADGLQAFSVRGSSNKEALKEALEDFLSILESSDLGTVNGIDPLEAFVKMAIFKDGLLFTGRSLLTYMPQTYVARILAGIGKIYAEFNESIDDKLVDLVVLNNTHNKKLVPWVSPKRLMAASSMSIEGIYRNDPVFLLPAEEGVDGHRFVRSKVNLGKGAGYVILKNLGKVKIGDRVYHAYMPHPKRGLAYTFLEYTLPDAESSLENTSRISENYSTTVETDSKKARKTVFVVTPDQYGRIFKVIGDHFTGDEEVQLTESTVHGRELKDFRLDFREDTTVEPENQNPETIEQYVLELVRSVAESVRQKRKAEEALHSLNLPRTAEKRIKSKKIEYLDRPSVAVIVVDKNQVADEQLRELKEKAEKVLVETLYEDERVIGTTNILNVFILPVDLNSISEEDFSEVHAQFRSVGESFALELTKLRPVQGKPVSRGEFIRNYSNRSLSRTEALEKINKYGLDIILVDAVEIGRVKDKDSGGMILKGQRFKFRSSPYREKANHILKALDEGYKDFIFEIFGKTGNVSRGLRMAIESAYLRKDKTTSKVTVPPINADLHIAANTVPLFMLSRGGEASIYIKGELGSLVRTISKKVSVHPVHVPGLTNSSIETILEDTELFGDYLQGVHIREKFIRDMFNERDVRQHRISREEAVERAKGNRKGAIMLINELAKRANVEVIYFHDPTSDTTGQVVIEGKKAVIEINLASADTETGYHEFMHFLLLTTKAKDEALYREVLDTMYDELLNNPYFKDILLDAIEYVKDMYPELAVGSYKFVEEVVTTAVGKILTKYGKEELLGTEENAVQKGAIRRAIEKILSIISDILYKITGQHIWKQEGIVNSGIVTGEVFRSYAKWLLGEIDDVELSNEVVKRSKSKRSFLNLETERLIGELAQKAGIPAEQIDLERARGAMVPPRIDYYGMAKSGLQIIIDTNISSAEEANTVVLHEFFHYLMYATSLKNYFLYNKVIDTIYFELLSSKDPLIQTVVHKAIGNLSAFYSLTLFGERYHPKQFEFKEEVIAHTITILYTILTRASVEGLGIPVSSKSESIFRRIVKSIMGTMLYAVTDDLTWLQDPKRINKLISKSLLKEYLDWLTDERDSVLINEDRLASRKIPYLKKRGYNTSGGYDFVDIIPLSGKKALISVPQEIHYLLAEEELLLPDGRLEKLYLYELNGRMYTWAEFYRDVEGYIYIPHSLASGYTREEFVNKMIQKLELLEDGHVKTMYSIPVALVEHYIHTSNKKEVKYEEALKHIMENSKLIYKRNFPFNDNSIIRFYFGQYFPRSLKRSSKDYEESRIDIEKLKEKIPYGMETPNELFNPETRFSMTVDLKKELDEYEKLYPEAKGNMAGFELYLLNKLTKVKLDIKFPFGEEVNKQLNKLPILVDPIGLTKINGIPTIPYYDIYGNDPIYKPETGVAALDLFMGIRSIAEYIESRSQEELEKFGISMNKQELLNALPYNVEPSMINLDPEVVHAIDDTGIMFGINTRILVIGRPRDLVSNAKIYTEKGLFDRETLWDVLYKIRGKKPQIESYDHTRLDERLVEKGKRKFRKCNA